MPNKKWDASEKDIIRKYVLETPLGGFSYYDLAILVGRTKNAVQLFALRSGLMRERFNKYRNLRYCISCKNVLSIDLFGKRKKRGEPESRCKDCNKMYYKEIYRKYKHLIENRRKDPKLIEHDSLKKKQYIKNNIERIIWLRARKSSIKRNLEFKIEPKDIIIPDKCPLLGIDFEFNGVMNNRDASPSLDRIDSRKGYIKGNIMVVSYRANRIKNNATLEELKLITQNLEKIITSPS